MEESCVPSLVQEEQELQNILSCLEEFAASYDQDLDNLSKIVSKQFTPLTLSSKPILKLPDCLIPI